MNFTLAFGRTLIWRPDRALGALYWYLTGRKVRARNRLRLAAAQSPHAYATWIETVERLPQIKANSASIIASWTFHPRFAILVFADPAAPAGAWEASLQSVRGQLYDGWELILALPEKTPVPVTLDVDAVTAIAASNASDAFNTAAEKAAGDYLIVLQPGDRLSPLALLHFGEALQRRELPHVLFGDEDRIDPRGRRAQPWFKPGWNEEMFLAQDYVSNAGAIRMDAARTALPIAGEHASIAPYVALLRIIAARNSAIGHVPHIVCHRGSNACPQQHQTARMEALSRHLEPKHAEVVAGPYGSACIKWPLPSKLPSVSVIVPTRDKVKLLRKCVEGVLHRTDYPDLELIIVDNGSVEPQTRNYLAHITAADPRVRVLGYEAPYNYSAINNFAAAHAKGEYLCLLNNDTEVMADNWLVDMMRQAVRPHVGAVGAKLLYADGSIQHAGVIVGLDDAPFHAHRFLQNGRPGYFNMPHLPHYVSAVTAACLVVEKRKFEVVRGFDADQLAVAFNDVDLCLKLENTGWRNVYEPAAVLIHHESKSRKQNVELYRRELSVLQQRWRYRSFADPFLNPNIDPRNGFLIQIPSRTETRRGIETVDSSSPSKAA